MSESAVFVADDSTSSREEERQQSQPIEENALLAAASPGSPPRASLKRNASDGIADLIRRAKASRTGESGIWKGSVKIEKGKEGEKEEEGEGKEDVEEEGPMDDSLEKALSCPICTDLLYTPVSNCLPTIHLKH